MDLYSQEPCGCGPGQGKTFLGSQKVGSRLGSTDFTPCLGINGPKTPKLHWVRRLSGHPIRAVSGTPNHPTGQVWLLTRAFALFSQLKRHHRLTLRARIAALVYAVSA